MKREDKAWAAFIAAFSVVAGVLSGIVQHALEEDPPPPASATTTQPIVQHEVGPDSGGIAAIPYWQWLIPTGTICVEVRGSTYATQAALDIFNHTDAKTLPARSNCAGYPRERIVKLVPRDFGTSATCAATGGTAWSQKSVRGIKAWVLADPTVWFNTNPKWRSACFGSAFAARHVYVHELMHALGMVHNHGIPSVVAADGPNYKNPYSWKYDVTTSWDRAETNRRY